MDDSRPTPTVAASDAPTAPPGGPAGPGLAHLPVKDGFRLRGLEMTRLETFTDAAFAFAMTLLVISFEPVLDMGQLRTALRDIPAFLASATMLMVFWWGHHEWSRRYGLDDGPTVVLSCLLVFTVLIYVVPLRFMFGMFFYWVGGLTGLPLSSQQLAITGPADVNGAFALYGVGFLAMSGALALLSLHAWRRRDALQLDPGEAHDTLTEAGVWGILGITGAASALVAVLTPDRLVGLAGWVYMSQPVAMPLYHRWRNGKRPGGALP